MQSTLSIYRVWVVSGREVSWKLVCCRTRLAPGGGILDELLGFQEPEDDGGRQGSVMGGRWMVGTGDLAFWTGSGSGSGQRNPDFSTRRSGGPWDLAFWTGSGKGQRESCAWTRGSVAATEPGSGEI